MAHFYREVHNLSATDYHQVPGLILALDAILMLHEVLQS
jgi:hypothetical protein